jgi:hypothetical protein
MQDQGTTTPGLKDPPFEEDAERMRAEGDAWAGHDRKDWARRTQLAMWLRSTEALQTLRPHHLTDEAGLCGCGERYTSHARHLLDALAEAVESG